MNEPKIQFTAEEVSRLMNQEVKCSIINCAARMALWVLGTTACVALTKRVIFGKKDKKKAK